MGHDLSSSCSLCSANAPDVTKSRCLSFYARLLRWDIDDDGGAELVPSRPFVAWRTGFVLKKGTVARAL